MSKPKIWMIIPTYYPVIGGAQSQVNRVSPALQAQGWLVQVLTRQHSPTYPDGLPAQAIIDGTSVTRIYSYGISKIASLLYVVGGLWHLLRYGRRNIYHAHDIGTAGWLAVVARYLLGGRCIIKLRTGRHAYQDYLASRLAHWQFMTLLHLTDRVIVVSSEVEEMLRALGIPATRVVRLPNMVDTQQFSPTSPEKRKETRQRLYLPAKKTIFLYVGRLAPYKGVDILIRAWALLPLAIHQQSYLVLAGDGPDQEQLCQLILSLGLTESVLMAGMQEAIRDYYWAADVLVLPSQTEGLSNALIEAMACGLPVIASNVGGALDVVEEGRNGLLFESENVEELAQKLSAILEMQAQWLEMGQQGRHKVMTYANLSVIITQLQAVYQQLEQEMDHRVPVSNRGVS